MNQALIFSDVAPLLQAHRMNKTLWPLWNAHIYKLIHIFTADIHTLGELRNLSLNERSYKREMKHLRCYAASLHTKSFSNFTKTQTKGQRAPMSERKKCLC